MKKLHIIAALIFGMLFAANAATAQTRRTTVRHHQVSTKQRADKQIPAYERPKKVGLVQKQQPRVISGQSRARIQLQLMQARKHEIEQARVDKAQMEAEREKQRLH